MRRSLDEAVLELGSLNDRDRILDFFFEHASQYFEFSVLFIVRGESAHGRNVHGMGAPPGLVARLILPLSDPGILSRARDERRTFVAPGPSEDADRTLFGLLGRALPAPIVVPVSVRDRVVAIFVGEAAVESAALGGAPSKRPPMELLKDEMVVWAESVGQVLERLILRRKGTGDSAPPPRFSSIPPAPFPAPPPPPRLPFLVAEPTIGGDDEPPSRAVQHAESRARWIAPVVAAALVVGGLGVWRLTRAESRSNNGIALAGNQLPGWPRVDPLAVIDPARRAADLGAQAELVTIEAELGGDARVDFSRHVENADGIFLRYVFVLGAVRSDVSVDSSGVRPGRKQPRERCADDVCDEPIAIPPQCSLQAILEGARGVGLDPDARALVRYGGPAGGRGGSEWLVSIPARGGIHLDARTCKPLPRERFRPPSLPVARIPGAPRSIDPLAIVPLARAQSGLGDDATILEIEARGITQAGVVDLEDPDGGITYTFAEPLGSKRRRWRQVSVRRDGMPIASDFGDHAPLPVRLAGSVVPLPRCTFAQAREYLARGAPAASAHLTYGPDIASGQTGLWSLEMATMPSRRTVGDTECDAWLKLTPRR